MKNYLVLEIGSSAYTEFKMKDGLFTETCDAILVDKLEAESKDAAYKKLLSEVEHKEKDFDHLLIIEVVDDVC